MKLIVLAVISIAVFRASCRERPNGRDLNNDGLNPTYGSTLPDDRDFSDGDDLYYGNDFSDGPKDEATTVDSNYVFSGPTDLVSSTDLDMIFPPLEFGRGDVQDGFQNYDSSEIVKQQKEDGTVQSDLKLRGSSKCKPDGVCSLLGGTCISNTTHCSGRVVPSLCGGGKCRCCFTVNMEVKMNDLETEFRSMVVNITAANSNLNTKLDSIMNFIISANSSQSNVNSNLDLKIDSIMSTNANLTIENSNLGLQISNLTIVNSVMQNELQIIKENLTISNAKQDAKLDSIRQQKGCPEGSFLFTPSNQCFRFLNDNLRTYDAAKAACKALGLQLAQPYDAHSLRNYLVQKYVLTRGTFIGARGDGSAFKWERTGKRITANIPLWWPGSPGVYVKTEHCLGLLTHEEWWKRHRTAAYWASSCNDKLYTLCEKIME